MNEMKEFEYIGVMASMVAYYLLVTGNVLLGATIGIIASSCLILYFGTLKSWPSAGLQLYFICANMYGLYNLGI
jgi:hypothetical protein